MVGRGGGGAGRDEFCPPVRSAAVPAAEPAEAVAAVTADVAAVATAAVAAAMAEAAAVMVDVGSVCSAEEDLEEALPDCDVWSLEAALACPDDEDSAGLPDAVCFCIGSLEAGSEFGESESRAGAGAPQ